MKYRVPGRWQQQPGVLWGEGAGLLNRSVSADMVSGTVPGIVTYY